MAFKLGLGQPISLGDRDQSQHRLEAFIPTIVVLAQLTVQEIAVQPAQPVGQGVGLQVGDLRQTRQQVAKHHVRIQEDAFGRLAEPCRQQGALLIVQPILSPATAPRHTA